MQNITFEAATSHQRWPVLLAPVLDAHREAVDAAPVSGASAAPFGRPKPLQGPSEGRLFRELCATPSPCDAEGTLVEPLHSAHRCSASEQAALS